MNEKYENCPFCDGTDLQRNVSGCWLDDENKTAVLEVTCENCGKDYEELYIFAYQQTEDGEKLGGD